MPMKIDQDHSRFQQIVRGKIKQNLRKYITHGEMIGRKGKDSSRIPLPQIDIPHFRYGTEQRGRRRAGRRRGRATRSARAGAAGRRRGQAGDEPGEHVLEVEVTLDELAEILGEELELPRIEPKGRARSSTSSKDTLHRHPPTGPGVAAALQAHLQARR